MERLIPILLPILGNLLKDPNVVRLLPTVLAMAQNFFPNVSSEALPAAAATALDTNAIKWVQTGLNILGESLDIDGVPGDATKAAVKKFQLAHGLEPDEWAGTETQERLRLAVLKGAG